MLAIPKEYIESICEIKTLTNDLLAMGAIIKIDIDALEIAGSNGEFMPLLQYRTPVKIYVHNSVRGSQVLAGTVYLSTRNFLRLEDVQQLSAFERRGAFRVNTSVEAFLIPYFAGSSQVAFDERLSLAFTEDIDETLVEEPEKNLTVRLLDVSLTGVRIHSEVKLIVGTLYFIKFEMLKCKRHLNLKIQRIINMPNGSVQYGGEFFDFSGKDLDLLCRDLFQLQRIEKSKRREAPI